MANAGIIPVSNETEASVVRNVDGRQLTYELKVLQQPQRARACGSGAKSAADRRPVDPPPVVELKIYEGEARTDVTFCHNANFFLFTTLESARPIATPRASSIANGAAGPSSSSSSSSTSISATHPVLTGTPVAGMAYLDRPSPAGYFIFPDLAVRHEGKYRLSFNLFAEYKGRDASIVSHTAALAAATVAANRKRQSLHPEPNACVDFCLEVKSEPFTVFSAKKFPGLTESTSLSRLVAEQGCRVRIRRDVRMRRREPKPNTGFDLEHDTTTLAAAPASTHNMPQHAGYAQSDRFSTPDTYNRPMASDRTRSISNASIDIPATPYGAHDRRASAHETPTYYPHATTYAASASSLPSASSFHQPMPQPISHPTPTSHPAYGSLPSSASIPTTLTDTSKSSTGLQSRSFGPGASYAHSMSAAMPPHTRHSSGSSAAAYPTPAVSQHSQQSSLSYPAPAPSNVSHTSDAADSSILLDARQRADAPPTYATYYTHDPAPASMPLFEHRYGYHPPSATASAAPASTTAPPLSIVTTGHVEARPNSPRTSFGAAGRYGHYAEHDRRFEFPPGPLLLPDPDSAPESSPTTPTDPMGSWRGGKRSYGRVFDTAHFSQPIHDGARSDLAGRDMVHVDCDEGLVDMQELVRMKMLSYRRADGSHQHKHMPEPASSSLTGQVAAPLHVYGH